MTNDHAYGKPLSVEVFNGEVVILASDGPVGMAMTAEAAAATAQRLAQAAQAALAHQASQIASDDC